VIWPFALRPRAGLGALAALCAAAVAVEHPAVAADGVLLEIREPEQLPFSASELRAAVAARVPLAAPGAADATTVTVAATPSGQVGVASPSRRHEVPLRGEDEAAAVRLVALAVLDVARAPLVVTPASTAAAVATEPERRGHRLALGIYPGVSTGLHGRAAAFEPTLDLSFRPARFERLGFGAEVGFARTSAIWTNRRLTLDSVPVRLGARLTWGFLEAGAGATVRLYQMRGLDAADEALVGGFASLRAALPLRHGLALVAAATCDLFQERLVFRARGAPVITTEHLVTWLAVGLTWSWEGRP
jgi:hypothetical protein